MIKDIQSGAGSKILENINLSELTTIGLGGNAKYFINCESAEEIIEVLRIAQENLINVQVLSGGSNIIFSDSGYNGLIIKIELKGIEFYEDEKFVYADVKAGESWDDFVIKCIEKNLSGIECLSGIPGSVGATPIQNVGAYGQEVSDSIVSLKAVDRNSLEKIIFLNKDCDFGYRHSRFKGKDKDKFIITDVRFRFEKNGEPEIRYPELLKSVEQNKKISGCLNLNEKINLIRKTVLDLRKAKSMLVDKSDPNSASCGSFFMNPVLNAEEYEKFKFRLPSEIKEEIPSYVYGEKCKISAAWLVEKAGFVKGYVKGGVGISKNHSLAIINLNGTADELLKFADEIEMTVKHKFGILLKKEPEVVR